jgi:hypothetical protein
VGNVVGKAVGVAVGTTVGATVGKALGTAVGTAVGDVDGVTQPVYGPSLVYTMPVVAVQASQLVALDSVAYRPEGHRLHILDPASGPLSAKWLAPQNEHSSVEVQEKNPGLHSRQPVAPSLGGNHTLDCVRVVVEPASHFLQTNSVGFVTSLKYPGEQLVHSLEPGEMPGTEPGSHTEHSVTVAAEEK